MYFIGKFQFRFSDVVLYPDKKNPHFEERLERVTKRLKLLEPKWSFQRLPQQKDLLRIVNVYSPYRSFVLFHDMGSGKTVTAILIAEQLRPFVQQHNKKVIVLVPNSMMKNATFMAEILGKVKHKGRTQYRPWCTGNTYISERLREVINNATDHVGPSLGSRVNLTPHGSSD